MHLTHPEKQLFESGFTKRDLADYYRAVVEAILPHCRMNWDGDA
jgi:bifunctional non-homologous end joining protein LigD